MSNDLPISASFTGAAYEKIENYLTTNGDDKAVKRIGKAIVTALPNALFAVAFTVETAVRLVLTALAKLAHFFMPKNAEFTRKYEEKVLHPLAESTAINGMIAGYVGASVVNNFMNTDQRKASGEKATAALFTVGNALFMKEVVVQEADEKYEAVTERQRNGFAKALMSVANIVANGHINGVYDSSAVVYETI